MGAMRAGFLLTVLALAGAYTYLAFDDLHYLSSTGRLGPGFFPRLIGASLVLLCLYSLASDWRPEREGAGASRFWRITAILAALSAAFVALLDVLGGLLSMIAFLAAALAILNRERPLQSALIAVALPVALYLVFRVWLNAALPRGMLPLPF